MLLDKEKEVEIINGFLSLISAWLDKVKNVNGHRYVVFGGDDFHRQLERSSDIYNLDEVATTMYKFSQNNEVTNIQLFMDGEIKGTINVNH